MNYAICWNGFKDVTTINISGSGLFCLSFPHFSQNVTTNSGFITGFTKSAGNQKQISSLVGTSETTRVTPYSTVLKGALPVSNRFCSKNTAINFSEWLGGIIDGDGSLQVSKKGYPSLEITMGLEDLHLLRFIQDKLKGSIKLRSGAKAYRYRLHNKIGMINLVAIINGHIRHSTRLLQLHKVCINLNEKIIMPIPLNKDSNWFAGFFDSDGTITISLKNGYPQLSIRVTNKALEDVIHFKSIFKGCIYFDSGQNGYYVWSIQSELDVNFFLQYFKKSLFKSHKSKRFYLIKDFYLYRSLKAYNVDSPHHKAWLVFLEKWNYRKVKI